MRYMRLTCTVNIGTVPERHTAIGRVGKREFSPFSLDIEKNGFSQAAKELGVTVVAYSPLGRGLISGRYLLCD